MAVRLVTLNVAGLGLGWFEGRFAAAVAGLRRVKPDILCLQEVALRREGTLYHQAAELGRALGLRSVAFTPYGNPTTSACSEDGGISIVGRWPMLDCRSRRLAPGLDESHDSRTALFVTFDTPEGERHIVNTHFSWRPEEEEVRLQQMRMLLYELEIYGWLGSNSPAVLAGDLNGTDDEPAIHLAQERMIDAFQKQHPDDPGYTWSEKNEYAKKWPMPNRRLDYVLLAGGLRAKSASLALTEPEPVYASDHFALVVDIESAT